MKEREREREYRTANLEIHHTHTHYTPARGSAACKYVLVSGQHMGTRPYTHN